MGVYNATTEYYSPISPPRLFKAHAFDYNIIIPKILPPGLKSIDNIQGYGGPGTIKLLLFDRGGTLKISVDEVNEETFTYKYTYLEGEILGNRYESVAYEVKFDATADGGTIHNLRIEYRTEANLQLSEEDLMRLVTKDLMIYKEVDHYLRQNPDLYNTTVSLVEGPRRRFRKSKKFEDYV